MGRQERRAVSSTGTEPAPPTGEATSEATTDGLGRRLRQARTDAGLSLRALAQQVGVSASLLSQIENAKVQPSVSTLYGIVTALGTSMDTVVFGADEPTPDEPPRAPAVVVPADASRHLADLRTGVRWEQLTPPAVAGVEFLLVTYEAGAESSPAGTSQRHAGREWFVVLEGDLRVHLGFDEHVVHPGDAMTYDSTIPHRIVNPGDTVARAVWVQLGELPEPV